ncbi:MAG: hypothetical protein JKX81_02405 [Arenicella sp.]|nr:hypothetical protein [Arenicella sp.]
MNSIRMTLSLFAGLLLASASSAQSPDAESLSSVEALAWQIFVGINRKNNDGQLIWESWTSQACLENSADCPSGRLHQSELRLANHADDPKRTGGCSAMTNKNSKPSPPTSLVPFIPQNLSADPVFCEEVTINPSEQAYAQSRGLLTIDGQMDYLQDGETIEFPWNAIEVKGDWVPASSFTDVTFDCAKPSKLIYTENIEGVCYALVGLHLNSKRFPNWLWATFEPQYSKTNPNRCNPDLYNSCYDSWGSNPPKSTGGETKPTAALKELFASAGASLDPAFQNYRLTGVQTEFEEPLHSNGSLGSSFVEFNAQVEPHQASCITCHSYAQRSIETGETPPGAAPKGYPSTGTPRPLSADFKSLDFSWFLGFGVPKE